MSKYTNTPYVYNVKNYSSSFNRYNNKPQLAYDTIQSEPSLIKKNNAPPHSLKKYIKSPEAIVVGNNIIIQEISLKDLGDPNNWTQKTKQALLKTFQSIDKLTQEYPNQGFKIIIKSNLNNIKFSIIPEDDIKPKYRMRNELRGRLRQGEGGFTRPETGVKHINKNAAFCEPKPQRALLMPSQYAINHYPNIDFTSFTSILRTSDIQYAQTLPDYWHDMMQAMGVLCSNQPNIIYTNSENQAQTQNILHFHIRDYNYPKTYLT